MVEASAAYIGSCRETSPSNQTSQEKQTNYDEASELCFGIIGLTVVSSAGDCGLVCVSIGAMNQLFDLRYEISTLYSLSLSFFPHPLPFVRILCSRWWLAGKVSFRNAFWNLQEFLRHYSQSCQCTIWSMPGTSQRGSPKSCFGILGRPLFHCFPLGFSLGKLISNKTTWTWLQPACSSNTRSKSKVRCWTKGVFKSAWLICNASLSCLRPCLRDSYPFC